MMIINYKEYIYNIKEGLIKTYNIEKYESSLYSELKSIGIDFELDIINKFKYKITININEFIKKSYDLFLSINNNLGYYPSYMFLYKNKKKNGFIFDKNELYNQLEKIEKIEIIFESKYEDGLYKNDLEIPKISYHISPVKNRDKIINTGLYPKSGSRKTYHNDRIYLFYNIEDCNDILIKLKANDIYNSIVQNYDLYEVNLNDKNIIHSDPNYDKGFYTYDNISVNNIHLIKENI